MTERINGVVKPGKERISVSLPGVKMFLILPSCKQHFYIIKSLRVFCERNRKYQS